MTEETKQPEVQAEADAAQETPASTDLTINDLMALRSIVEVASQRGAFKAAELEAVGKTFNKLNTFLEAVAASKKED
jgi:hypothetical protein